MKVIKPLLYLELKSLLNKVKNWREYKFQFLFFLLFLGLNIFSLFIGASKIPGPSFSFIKEYSVDISYFLILIVILNSIKVGDNKFPFKVPKSVSILLFCTSFKRKKIVYYLVIKDMLLKLIIGFCLVSFGSFIVLENFFPSGWFYSWAGLFFLFMLGKVFAIINFNLQKKYEVNLSWISILISVSLGAYLIGGAIDNGLRGVLASWRRIYSFLTIGLNWLVELFIYPVIPSGITLVNITIPLFFILVGFMLAVFYLPDCKEEISQLLNQRQKISQGLKSGEFEDPQKMMLLFSSPQRSSKVASWSPNPGPGKALLWKRLVEWERFWKGELKTAFSFLLVICLPLSLVVAFWELPYWLILVVSILLNQQGRNVIVETKRSLIYNLSANWMQKIPALILPTLVENIIYQLMAAGIFFTIIYLIRGIFVAEKLAGIVLLSGGLNVLFIVLGLFGYLLSLNFIGFWKGVVKFLPLIIHFVLVIGIAYLLNWQLQYMILISLILILLSYGWLKLLVNLFQKTSYDRL